MQLVGQEKRIKFLGYETEERERTIKDRVSKFVRLTKKVESLPERTDYANKETRDESEVTENRWVRGVWGLPAFDKI